jgi:hypothetical protein
MGEGGGAVLISDVYKMKVQNTDYWIFLGII